MNKIETRPKKTRQGRGKHSKYAASSRNKARKDTEVREDDQSRYV